MSQWDQQDIELFHKDAHQLLLTVQDNILKLEKNSNDKEAINHIFRGMHTIKGASAMFGFNDISEFTHRVENVLSHVRENRIVVTSELITLMLTARDHIKLMFRETDGKIKPDTELRKMIIEAFESFLPTDNTRIAIVQKDSQPIVSDKEKFTYSIQLSVNSKISPSDHYLVLLVLLNKLSRMGDCSLAHYPEDVLSDHSSYIWNIIINTSSDIESLKEGFDFVDDISLVKIELVKDNHIENTDDMIPKLGEILSKFNDVTQEDIDNAISRQKQISKLLSSHGNIPKAKLDLILNSKKTSQKNLDENISIDQSSSSEKLDKLINLIGELVFVQSQITHVTEMSNSIELNAPIRQLELLTSELRNCVLSIRMAPFGTIFSQFQRLVRDLANELGKEIVLITEGADVELYKTDIDRLIKPMLHMIRNSIDHGIEPPLERQKANKPEKGTIKVAAAYKSANIVITVEDDGKGLDTVSIRKKAIEKGLILNDAKLSEKEIFALIFAPGFSTSEKVTNISGRGVGMDVVQQCVSELSGTIEISSQRGVKTTFCIQLPLPLAIIDGLLVRIGASYFIIPLDTVVECLDLTNHDMNISQNRDIITVRGELIPFIWLKNFFLIKSDELHSENIVILKIEGFKTGIAVDEILGDYKAVIKPLGDFFQETKGISGTTILGNGIMALIIDVSHIINSAKEEERRKKF